jgi:quercetin dioxygenase-like cupin family protein
MNGMMRALMIAAVTATVAPVPVQATETHRMVTATEIPWRPGPASLPPGAQMSMLYGDAGKEGLFAMRLKLPPGYAIPPHNHPRPEIVTVISGTFHLGTGETADRARTKALPAGSFFAFEPGMTHFVFTDEETVVQLNSTGPWGIAYVNPADDPRRRPQ